MFLVRGSIPCFILVSYPSFIPWFHTPVSYPLCLTGELPDPIGYHIHSFVLKVNIEKREVTVGITDCEVALGNKKKKECKLTG